MRPCCPICCDDEKSSKILKLLKVGLCILWASNFATAKLVMNEPGVDSSLYALSRFGIAALALLPGSIAAVRRGVIDWNTTKNAAICGSWVAFGYLGQTIGLLSTTASRSCVICTLHCVFVAIIAEIMRVSRIKQEEIITTITIDADNNNIQTKSNNEKNFDLTRLIPAAIAVMGVAVIELKGAGGEPSIGDLISFSQPIGFGLGYLQLEELMKERPEAALPVSAIKLIVVAFASFLFYELSPLFLSNNNNAEFMFRMPDFTPILSSKIALRGILYTGLITTSFALWIESIAFKHVPATDASIILTTEPLFAAIASSFALGETFGVSDYFGAILILGACVYAILLDDKGEEVSSVDDQNNRNLFVE